MEDVFASIASGVITADIDKQITLCNKAAEDILASPSNEILQTSLSDLLSVLSEDLNESVQQAMEQDARFVDLEIHPRHSQRGELDLQLSITPIKTAEDRTRGVAIVMDDLTEKRRLQAQRRLFERMVSPAVIDQLDPDSIQLGGEITETTILFADIRGYTSFSASMDPKSLVEILNRYLSAAAEAVLEQEGTIDKFLGDAVMAWFNAPIPQPDHSLRAARAALGIRRAVNELNTDSDENRQLSFGIGVHCGEALLGLVGSQKRLDYTAIGDTVNISKRLQENAQPGQILVSGNVQQVLLGSAGFTELPPLKARGVLQEISVYELHSLSETLLF
jgi:PAS domain S-box-containing protein